MPVSEISGLAGTLPPIQDPGGLHAFAEHLANARERDRQAALKELDMFVNLTNQTGGQFTPDPKELQKVAKRAGLGAMVGGAGGANDMFAALRSTAKTQAERATTEFETGQKEKTAQIEELGARTQQAKDASARDQAETARIQQETGFAATHEAMEKDYRQAVKRVSDPESYPENDPTSAAKKEADVKQIMLHDKLSDAQTQRLGLTAAQVKKLQDDLDAENKLHQDAAKLSMVNTLSGFSIKDPKTGKERAMTTDELETFSKTGKTPPGLTTPQMKELAYKAAQTSAELMNSRAAMERAKAEGKIAEAQVHEYEAHAEDYLAQASLARKKAAGTVPADAEEIIKAIEGFKAVKQAGGKPDQQALNQLQKLLASKFGITTEESKGWLQRIMDRGFAIFGEDETQGKPAAVLNEGVDTSLSGRAGQAVRNLPSAVVGFQKGIESAERKIATGTENFLSNIVTGKSIEPEKPLTDEQVQQYINSVK